MVAKKQTETPQWGNPPKPAEDDDIPEFLKRGKEGAPPTPDDITGDNTATPAQTDLEEAIAETKPENPEPFMQTTSGDENAESGVKTSDQEREAAAPAQGGDGRSLSADDNEKPKTVADDAGTVAGQQLFAFVERYERLEEEKKTIADDQKEVLAEAKGTGFDVPTIRKLIRLRKMDPAQRQEAEELLDVYKSAIGMA